MHQYRICGTTFQSNVSIPELAPDAQQYPEFTFELSLDPWRPLQPHCWLNHWYLEDGSKWLSFARIESGYLLRFPALADFTVSLDGRSVSCHLRNECPPETMRHLLLNQVIPITLSQLGKLVLHASACATARGVMAFVGTTGMGKSTLAASFGLQGFPILTDDCLMVEKQQDKIACVSSYAGLRLWPENVSALFEQEPELQPMAHYTDKKRVLFNQAAIEGTHFLKSIYVLAQSNDEQMDGVTIIPLSSSDALFEIVKHTFQLDVTDRQRLGQAFKRYEWLAKSIPFFRLTYPRDHAFLPTVHTTILNHLEMIQDPAVAG